MRTGQWFTVAFLFITLLAVGLQCQDQNHREQGRHVRRNRRNQRRLRSGQVRRPRDSEGPAPGGDLPVITPWPIDPSNPYGFRSETAPEPSGPVEQPAEINKTVWEDMSENATNETEGASPTLSTDQWHTRLRSKQARLFRIQMEILRKLGLRRQPNITSPIYPSGLPIPEHLEAGEPSSDYDDSVYSYDEEDVVERLQFLRPSCDLPKRSDPTWNDASSFRILFKISSTMNNPNIRITSAFLRLFKKTIPGCDCHSNGSPGSRLRRLRNGGRRRRQQGDTRVHVHDYEETERIRITVFKYNKPVRRGRRERKTLVDSIMVEKSAEGWQSLDIKQAVTAWIKNPNNNFGLLVQVEDMDQNDLDATQIFGTLNCSANASLPGIPLNPDVLEDGLPMPSQNQSSPYMELMSVQSFATNQRRRRESPSKCQLKHRSISLYDLGIKSASLDDQIKIGYCEGSCGTDPSGKQSSCRAESWENKILTELSQGRTTEMSVYNKLSATSCSCQQVSLHT